MRHIWMPAALTCAVIASPAVAQQKIAPTVTYGGQSPTEYRSVPPTPLDKNYGVPSFGQQGSELPQQKAATRDAPPVEKPDVFKPFTGLNPPQPPQLQGPSTPDFFAGSTEITLPKARKGASSTETPLFTTSDGAATEESPFDRSSANDSPFNRSRSSDTLSDGPWAGTNTTTGGGR